MSVHRKRKLEERSDDYSGGIEAEMSKTSSANKRNTLDSDDDEDDDAAYNRKKYEVLKDEDIEGQEDSTIDFDGQTKITPFNMKDELEEGHFDSNGTYIWNKKDGSEIRDSWLDSIDWVKVKRPEDGSKKDEESSGPEPVLDTLEMYKTMLTYMRPGESVLAAVKRLGGGGKQLSASEKLKQKKFVKKPKPPPGSEGVVVPTERKAPEEVEKLTEVANAILSATGNMDVYEETHESITFKIANANNPKVTNDDGSDMFADEFEVKETAKDETADASSEVYWEFKWEDKEDAPIYGPHSSSQMNDWVTQGYFKTGVFVRKKGQASNFYTSRRIDFDLYC